MRAILRSLACGELKAKAFGPKPLPSGQVWAEIPRDSVWIFPGAGQA